ncbi:hypothetical protein MMC10_001311 [Thelotrema lepadinum]|nr:hypothetical protein [Thelotrema lepadinum]
MASTGGLTRRRGAAGSSTRDDDAAAGRSGSPASRSANPTDRIPETSYTSSENGHIVGVDLRDMDESRERSKQPKLTLMEETLLMGLKDKQVGRGSLGREEKDVADVDVLTAGDGLREMKANGAGFVL